MSANGKIPGPYVHTVKREDSLMEYTNIETMDIGARRSGLPGEASQGPKSLQHVGEGPGRKAKEGK